MKTSNYHRAIAHGKFSDFFFLHQWIAPIKGVLSVLFICHSMQYFLRKMRNTGKESTFFDGRFDGKESGADSEPQ